ncbi:hypothetical protein ZIOFF_022517 [Zingiber officinale]|uniref:Pre-mRNA-splicing factor SLU7 n=1 Tax=Zingiber officinale TaxID=94328 RepID=A0A8J5H309_ZINOF|nr:hypothetical protein ZIOFF_022517 [Zingiber officinale]
MWSNTHDKKSCMERPRKVGSKWTNMHIVPDEKVESFELDYDGKRDRWNGHEASTYSRVIEQYEAREEARRKFLKEQQLKKLEGKNSLQNGENAASDDDVDEEDLKIDEAKVAESKQTDFAKVENRVRTTGGGSTGTVRTTTLLPYALSSPAMVDGRGTVASTGRGWHNRRCIDAQETGDGDRKGKSGGQRPTPVIGLSARLLASFECP